MRRYAPQAAPDDPNVWTAMSGFYPTPRGTYRTADYVVTTANKTATSETDCNYAYCAKTLTGTRSYVLGDKIWEYSGATAGTLTDRTNSVTVGDNPMMAQYGNITICAMGTSAATVYSSGGNFSALATAPNAEFIVVQNNVVLLLNYNDGSNTYNDGWFASDVGDYTQWTPGASNDSANGRLLDTNGPITGAAVLGNYVYVFKSDSIYRGTYVGGTLKWRWELVYRGIGMNADFKHSICPAGNYIAFMGNGLDGATGSAKIYLFDGASPPICINQELFISEMGYKFYFDSVEASLYLVETQGIVGGVPCHAYNAESGLWGVSEDSYGISGKVAIPIMGESGAISEHIYGSSNAARSPVAWHNPSSGNLALQYVSPPASASGTVTSYVRSHRYGRADAKTFVRRVTPLLRKRTQISGQATGTVALEVRTFTERHDSTAATTTAVTESTQRDRFDFTKTDTYLDFKATFTNFDVEIDDLLVDQKVAGTD